MNTNTLKGLIAGAIVGIVIGGSPAMADDPQPVTDHMATQDPQAYSDWVDTPCATKRSVDCYVDVIGQTGQFGWSYWRIRVGHKVCIRYWDAVYNRKHGHCRPVR